MTDFLKAHPFISREEYLWQLTVPQTKLMMYDTTHVEYSKSKSKKDNKRSGSRKKPSSSNVTKLDSPEALAAWMGQTGGKVK